MAELGDYLQQGATSGKEVTVEMMDYKYIETCNDQAELRAILNRLRSKEEGYYPHLEKTVEDKLMDMLPEKERRKVLALRTGPDAHEIVEAGAALSAWADQVRVEDKVIEEESINDYVRPLPPVRGQKATKTKAVTKEEEPKPKKEKKPSAHVYDAPDYFRKWDAYDAEAEEQKIENTEVEALLEAERVTKAHEVKEKGRAARREAELAELRGKMEWATMSKVQRNRFALLEKNKGNECFKGGEPEEAMHYYSRALALIDDDHEQACVLWANRAMAALKVGLLERAEDDCTRAIQLNPDYHKARLRRGMTRHKRGRYAGAVEDFDWLIKANTSIEDVAKLRERSYQKHLEVDGESKAKIVEVASTMVVPLNKGAPPVLDLETWEVKPFVLPSDIEKLQTKSFTKIAISVDDDSSEEEEEEEEEEEGVCEGMSRVTIVEEDDEEEVEEENDETSQTEKEGMSEWEATKLKQKGVELFMKSQYSEATEAFQKSLSGVEAAALNQSKPVATVFGNLWHALRNNLAACALATEQWDKVVEHCDAVIHHQPGNLKALLRRAEARERLGKTAGACSDLQAALRIDSNNLEAAERLKLLSSVDTTAPRVASEAAKVRGNEAMARGSWEEAYALYTDALAHDPSNMAARNNRCMCALKQEKWGAAESDANGVLSVSPENAKALFRRATARKALKSYEGAEKDLLAALVVEPTNGKAKDLLTEVRSLLSEQAEEIEKFASAQIEVVEDDDEPIIEDVPRGTRVQIVEEEDSDESEEEEKGTRVQIVEEEDSDESEEEEKGSRVQIVEEEGEDEEFSPYEQEAAMRSEDCKLKGNQAMGNGDFELAYRCYSQAIHFDKNNLAARNNRSVAALKLGKFSEARDDSSLVLSVEPENVKALMRRSTASVELVELEDAVRDLEAVLKIDPSNVDAASKLKEVTQMISGNDVRNSDQPEVEEHSEVEETIKVEAVSEPQVEKVPESQVEEGVSDRESSDKEKALGNESLGGGDLDKAEAHYCRAVELDHSNTAAYNNRALCRLRQKNWQGCIDDASLVLTREEGNSKALLRRSQAYDALGKLDEARSDLVQVLKGDPKHKEANSRFVALVKKTGDSQPANPTKSLVNQVSSSSSPSDGPSESETKTAPPVTKKKKKEPAQTTPVRTIKVKVKVPSEPPSTISELERSWRELKAHPEHLATYLKLFKVATYKKVFKESISPDIIPQLLAVANKELSTESSPSYDLPAALRVLKGLTRSKCFTFTLMLLSDEDKSNIQAALQTLQANKKYQSEVEELKLLYKI
jgi:tetratricopeptide (TPR) repeat protein